MRPYYRHAGITIYHGDCRDLLPSLEPVDCVLTDPPYGIVNKGGKWEQWGKPDKEKRAAMKVWDRTTIDYLDQIVAMGRTAIIWGGNYYALPPSRGWLVWRKPDRVPTAADCEFAWTNLDMNARVFDWSIAATNAERVGHQAQKPIAVMTWCLSFAAEARTILDPFMGSGTTLVVAKRNGMHAIGIEINERYCEIAAERLRQDVLPLERPA
jgi:site-specific DNA-methyltransferase (adenine-specific)